MGSYPKPVGQPSSVHHAAVGDVVVSTINDGIFQLSFDDIVDADRAECETAHRAAHRVAPPWLTINTFLIRTGNKLALIDAGFGSEETPLVGKLVENLATIGVAPDDIDVMLMTHLHPDHERGLTDSAGHAVFPNAELVVHEDEIAFWLDDGELARAPDTGKGNFALARTAVAAYRDRIRTVTDGEVLPGCPGRTDPGTHAGTHRLADRIRREIASHLGRHHPFPGRPVRPSPRLRRLRPRRAGGGGGAQTHPRFRGRRETRRGRRPPRFPRLRSC